MGNTYHPLASSMNLPFEPGGGEVKALKKRWRIHSFCGAQQREKGVGDVTTLDCIRL